MATDATADRSDTGDLAIRSVPVDLVPVVARAIEANAPYAAGLGVRFELERAPASAEVLADRGRVEQVLANLLSNAAKHSPAGEAVTVAIDEAGAGFRVSVRDRGPGVPEAFRARIFQRYAQAEGQNAAGTSGLGLHIAKRLVEKMGGAIGFEAAEGGGARFHFDLPRATP